MWVTMPPGKPPAVPRPAVVPVHWGPWLRGGEWAWNPWTQFLASRGYVVIEPEYLGSTGFGETHFRAGWKHWGDTRDALIAAKHPPEWIVYEGEGHGWLKVENDIDFWRRVEACLAKQLQ